MISQYINFVINVLRNDKCKLKSITTYVYMLLSYKFQFNEGKNILREKRLQFNYNL